ncbi:MAG: gamma carbonic anhydrase family protein [Pseudomonadota bacterium]
MSMIHNYKDISPKIAASVFVAEGAQIIGDVEIKSRSNIWFNAVIRGDVNDIKIGQRTNIQDLTLIHVATFGQGCYVGDDVTVGHSAILHACNIGDMAYIGMQSCILDGATVEEKAMLAAGSLLTSGKTVPTGELWAGSPARFMRKLTQKDFDMMAWSAEHYCQLAESYTKRLD